MRDIFLVILAVCQPFAALAQDGDCLSDVAPCALAAALSKDLPIDLPQGGQIWKIEADDGLLSFQTRKGAAVPPSAVIDGFTTFACAVPALLAFARAGGNVTFNFHRSMPNVFFDPAQCEAN
jgi:hypothetical protein